MGRTTTPKYRLEYLDNSRSGIAVHVYDARHYGKPTPESVEKWAVDFAKSQEIGQVNEHLSKASGYIRVPHYGRIVNQWTGVTAAEWKAPQFWSY